MIALTRSDDVSEAQTVTAAVVFVVTLIAFGSSSGGKPGQHYIPPSYKDGHIEPGRIE